MKICFFLHFYQPYNQQDDILIRIVNECYLPLTRGLLNTPKAKAVVNINASLSRLLVEKGYSEVIDNLKELHKQGKIEFSGSSVYHAFLPLMPESEITRQIDSNIEINKKIFGDLFEPRGFFSPEMAVSDIVLKMAKETGHDWMVCPSVSYRGEKFETDKLYIDQNTKLKLLFRNKRVSSIILSSVCRDVEDFVKETQDIINVDKYWLCVMDAETFGHHRIGHEKFLFEIMQDARFEPTLASKIIDGLSDVEEVRIRPSTWSNEEQDFWLDKEKTQSTDAKSFILWKDPENPIHALQWELTDLAIEYLANYDNKSSEDYVKARELLDVALSSDQYWWASAKPWWSLEMVEVGAYQLKSVIGTLGTGTKTMVKADEIYRKILDKAFEWQRDGIIRKRHLDNSGTYLKQTFKRRTPPDWFNLMILELEYEMILSAQRRDFEKAIKWRDALLKIQLETDIYDVLHVVDELWSAKHLPNLKAFVEFEWDELSDFVKPYLIDREGNTLTKEAFEIWKKEAKSSTKQS